MLPVLNLIQLTRYCFGKTTPYLFSIIPAGAKNFPNELHESFRTRFGDLCFQFSSRVLLFPNDNPPLNIKKTSQNIPEESMHMELNQSIISNLITIYFQV